MTSPIPAKFVTFVELCTALRPLHQFDPSMVNDLHDVWKQGAPSPDTIIRNPKDYDERKRQAGNVEKRLMLPLPLMGWIERATAKRGMPVSAAQAAALLEGKTRYNW